MHASLADGTLILEFGARFGAADAARIRETFEAFAPVEQLRLDFSSVRSWEETAFALVAKALAAHPPRRVSIQGLDRRHRSMLGRLPDLPEEEDGDR